MLARRNRLIRAADFSAAMKRGTGRARGASRSLVVQVTTDRSASQSTRPVGIRVGFAVSKAVGPSVTRNLVQRRLRELCRERLLDWPADVDVVVRALPPAAQANYAELGRDLDKAWASARRHLGQRPTDDQVSR